MTFLFEFRRFRTLWSALLLSACVQMPPRAESPPQKIELRADQAAEGREWIISTQGKHSTQAAFEILSRGGSVLDAGIAASFSISVERPHSTGLGGGGFALYREAKTGKVYAIDFRERAPAAASAKTYLDKNQDIIPDKSLTGIEAGGTPGLVKGLIALHQKFGTLPFHQLVVPAIQLAKTGFSIYPTLGEALESERYRLLQYPSSAKIFFKADKQVLQTGDWLVQEDLAKTLLDIGKTSGKSFYTGRIAKAIQTPWVTAKDLQNYSVKWRDPIKATIRGYDIYSMPPPSSGGIHVIQILKMVDTMLPTEINPFSVDTISKTSLAMKAAFLDRARYLGDPDFAKIPVQALVSNQYLDQRARELLAYKAIPDLKTFGEKTTIIPENEHTTHLSIMDKEGNVFVSTQTINGWFGSAYVVPGTGIVWNNEMDDFAMKAGATNQFGAVGGDQNLVAPNKTPLSSMSPTLVLNKKGEPVLAVGAPGGTRIINCVAETLMNYLFYKYSLSDSVAAPRYHHQWSPDVLTLEPRLYERKGLAAELTAKGWKVEAGKVGCYVMAVAKDGDLLSGVSDPRDFGTAQGQ